MPSGLVAVNRSHDNVEVALRVGGHGRRSSDLAGRLVQEERPALQFLRALRTRRERHVGNVVRDLFCRAVHVGGLNGCHQRVQRNGHPDAYESDESQRRDTHTNQMDGLPIVTFSRLNFGRLSSISITLTNTCLSLGSCLL